jgi:hypothetical protein
MRVYGPRTHGSSGIQFGTGCSGQGLVDVCVQPRVENDRESYLLVLWRQGGRHVRLPMYRGQFGRSDRRGRPES